jgi:acyl-CoA dehydrogenase
MKLQERVFRFEMSSNVARDASVETKQKPWPSSTLSSGIFSGGTDPVENVFRHNLWLDDPALRKQVRQYAGRDLTQQEEAYLAEAGRVIGGPVARNADVIDKHGPELVKFDRMGQEINEVVHHPAGLESRRLLWRLAPGAFNGKLPGTTSPVALTAMHLMLGSVDCGLSCATGVTPPMTYLVHEFTKDRPALHEMLVKGLEEPCYDKSLFSTIWLTEQSGGSDLGALETVATLGPDGNWRLRGLKWFCSITDARLIMTVARPSHLPKGIGNLALFIIPRDGFEGSPQQPGAIHIRRLKQKLGLKSVPSGEVELRDAFAWPLGDPLDGKGIQRVMSVVSPLQRNGVASMGAGIARRCFVYAREYATYRMSWGKSLLDHGSFRVNLMDIMTMSEAAFAIVLKVSSLTDAFGQPSLAPLVRILAPLSKLRSCRVGVVAASRAVEVFGGNGYIQDWPIERLYRDAQNSPIWEGSEQIMSIDVLRALNRWDVAKEFCSFIEDISKAAAPLTLLQPIVAALDELFGSLHGHVLAVSSQKPKFRDDSLLFANALADVVQLALLLGEAAWELKHLLSGRKAVVAAWFAFSLQPTSVQAKRLSGDKRCPLLSTEVFHSVVRQENIAPDAAFPTVNFLLPKKSNL